MSTSLSVLKTILTKTTFPKASPAGTTAEDRLRAMENHLAKNVFQRGNIQFVIKDGRSIHCGLKENSFKLSSYEDQEMPVGHDIEFTARLKLNYTISIYNKQTMEEILEKLVSQIAKRIDRLPVQSVDVGASVPDDKVPSGEISEVYVSGAISL